MTLPVLTTKLHVPELHRPVVPRDRLLALLNERLPRKLTLVSAPAGYGKSTLAVQWLSQTSWPVAWLSLEPDDNDPVRFLTYFVAALRRHASDFGKPILSALQGPQLPHLDALWIQLLNELAAYPAPLALVMDDLHVIDEPAIVEGLNRLLDNQPPNLHLVILTREDPPFRLARLRARGDMVELRARDLTFSESESASFMDEVMNLSLSPAQLAALDKRTEGWIAGLQMAALSLQNADDRDAFIDAFSGSHRHILDFLSEEVLRAVSDEIRAFLLDTSVLQRLSASLCDAVRQASNSRQMLHNLEQANLFLIGLDHERQWYRYHHLFAGLLQRQLLQKDPGRPALLHRRAAAWHEANGMIPEAFHHAQSAGDEALVASLLEAHALSFIERGHVNSTARWYNLLPEHVIRARPRMNMDRAWMRFVAADFAPLEAQLADIDAELPALADEAVRAGVSGELNAMRAFLTLSDLDQKRKLAQQALDVVPKENFFVRGLAHMALASACNHAGRKADAAKQFIRAIGALRRAGNHIAAMMAGLDLVQLGAALGHLTMVEDVYRDLTAWVEAADLEETPTVGLLYMGVGTLNLYRHRIPEALHDLRRGMTVAEIGGYQLDYGRMALGVALVMAGEEREARKTLETLREGLGEMPETLNRAYTAWLVDTYLTLNDVATAAQVLSTPAADPEDVVMQLARARLKIGSVATGESVGALEDVAAELDRIVPFLAERAWNGYLIEALLLRALARHQLALPEAAVEDVRRAVLLAAPEEIRHPFVKHGALMGALLAAAADAGVSHPFTYTLRETIGSTAPATPPAHPDLAEPLTEREFEVLELMRAGLTYRDIAERLFISVNTVRYHVKGLYGKLGVSSRAEAIARGQALDLFSLSD